MFLYILMLIALFYLAVLFLCSKIKFSKYICASLITYFIVAVLSFSLYNVASIEYSHNKNYNYTSTTTFVRSTKTEIASIDKIKDTNDTLFILPEENGCFVFYEKAYYGWRKRTLDRSKYTINIEVSDSANAPYLVTDVSVINETSTYKSLRLYPWICPLQIEPNIYNNESLNMVYTFYVPAGSIVG